MSRAPTPARKQPFREFPQKRLVLDTSTAASSRTRKTAKLAGPSLLVPLGYSSLLITSLLPFASPPHHPSPPPSTSLFFLALCRVGESPSPAPFGRRSGTVSSFHYLRRNASAATLPPARQRIEVYLMSTVVSQYQIARTALQRVRFERCYRHSPAPV